MIELALDSPAQHTGTERYALSFAVNAQGPEHDTQGNYVQFTFRPEYVILKWERSLGGVWRPRLHSGVSQHTKGSRICGHRVLKDGSLGEQEGWQDVWTSGRLSAYALSLPGLEELINTIAKELPA